MPLFADLLHVIPRRVDLYQLALTHSSASPAAGMPEGVSYERLEYLGDAVIELAVSEYLYARYPNLQEGDLTQLRARIVSRETINRLAEEVALHRFIRHSIHSARIPGNVLGNAFEALFGAIFLDRGYRVARRVLYEEFLCKRVDMAQLSEHRLDSKSKLYGWAQRANLPFELLVSQAPGLPVRFCAAVTIAGEEVCSAYGSSKKKAEQLACQAFFDRGLEQRNYATAAQGVAAAESPFGG